MSNGWLPRHRRACAHADHLVCYCFCLLLSLCVCEQKLSKFENEKYMRSHPELGVLIQDFVVHVLETRPANVEEAAIHFFVSEGSKRAAAAAANNTNNAAVQSTHSTLASQAKKP